MAAGAALTLGALAIGAVTVIEAGLFDTRAITLHGPLAGWAAHTVMIADVRRRARAIEAPAAFSAAQVSEGFDLYEAHCAMCHGGPGLPRASWTTGLTPTPPFLLDAARDWTPAELDLLVGDGIKMTAMPAWRTTLSGPDVWRLVAFLEALPYLSPTDYQRLRQAAAARRGGGNAARSRARDPGP